MHQDAFDLMAGGVGNEIKSSSKNLNSKKIFKKMIEIRLAERMI